jgi:hypothetical protein
VCCPLRLRRNQPLSADLPPKLPQSFATNIAVFVANDVAARAAKTAGVNRKSYVIQTPLTYQTSIRRKNTRVICTVGGLQVVVGFCIIMRRANIKKVY